MYMYIHIQTAAIICEGLIGSQAPALRRRYVPRRSPVQVFDGLHRGSLQYLVNQVVIGPIEFYGYAFFL
jgi:hypothetical protein